MRVFLDANILFSAAKSDGAIRRLLVLLVKTGHSCHADAFVIEEARRNLALKLPRSLGALDEIMGFVEVAHHPVFAEPGLDSLLPEKDRPVLAAAIGLRCDILLTGDRTHFGSLFGTAVHGVEVLSPAGLGRRLTES